MPDKILQSDGSVIPIVATVGATTASKGYQQITNVSAAVGLTPPVGARLATIVAESQDVRWRDDGTAPTATVGMLLTKGTQLQYAGDLTAIKFIETAASAALNVTYSA